MNRKPVIFYLSLLTSIAMCHNGLTADGAIGKADINFNLRYESVEQDNALSDAEALTLRTRFTYTFNEHDGLSGLLEFEDSRSLFGFDDYNNAIGNNAGIYSVIADPETTELDQAYIQYRNGSLTLKAGRQVITHDNHRFVGHVAWRQDRQTFDGMNVHFAASDKLRFNYSYISQRNRIFAEEADIESDDHLLNISFDSEIGKVTAYSYLLEVDNNTNNTLDTYGISLNGTSAVSEHRFLYHLEFATQSARNGVGDFDADYLFVEAGTAISNVTTKIGYEVLGSDNRNYGFSTPLATLHKFNGFADQFLSTPGTGLVDLYVTASTSALGANWALTYHDFSADDSGPGISDYGNELDLSITKKFATRYTVGLKYANYSAGDFATGKVDTNKLWIWLSARY